MRNDQVIFRYVSSTLTASCLALPANAQDGLAGWDWGLEINGWLPDIEMTTADGVDIDLTISEILDNLDFTLQGGVFATKGNWLVFADGLYLGLAASDKVSGKIGPIDTTLEADIDQSAFISTFGAGYKFYQTPDTMVHAIGGLRYLYMDLELEGSLGSIDLEFDESDDNWDAIVGLQGKTKINEKWSFHYYGDIGTGESDLTVQAKVGFAYAFESFDLTLSYRYMDFDFDGNDSLDDLTIYGPQIGAVFRF